MSIPRQAQCMNNVKEQDNGFLTKNKKNYIISSYIKIVDQQL